MKHFEGPTRRALMAGAAVMALVGVASSASAAMRVQPMSYELEPSGSRASQDVRVENPDSRPLPIEITVERRHIGENGEDTREPAEDDFLIFPPQAIVPPNGFQNIRVQYIGDPTRAETALYVITVAQLPVDTTGREQSGVEILLNLGMSVAVSPRSARADLVVVEVVPTENGKLTIAVENRGDRFARLHTGSWTFSNAGQTETLSGESLKEAVQQPLIEPGERRVIVLPVSATFVREGATAAYAYTAPNLR